MNKELAENIFELINAAGNNPGEIKPELLEAQKQQRLEEATFLTRILSYPHILRAIAAKDTDHTTNPVFDLGTYIRDDANKRNVKLELHITFADYGGRREKPDFDLVEVITTRPMTKGDKRKKSELRESFPEYTFDIGKEDKYDNEFLYGTRNLALETLAEAHGSHLKEITVAITKLLRE